MAPLGLGTGFYGVGPAMGSDNAAGVVTPIGTAVRVVRGTDEGVIATQGANLKSTFQGSFTIAFWIEVVSGQTDYAPFIFGSLGDGTDLITLQNATDGKLTFTFAGDSDTHQNKTDAAVFASGANAYKHIAVTMTKVGGGNSTSIIYVDGDAVNTSIVGSNEIAEAKHAAFDDEGDVFAIGAIGTVLDSNTTGLGIPADFAEFAIWNAALDAAAVAVVHDAGKPTAANNPNLLVDEDDYDVSSNLVAYWKLNDYSGGRAKESKSGFDARLNGVSVFI